MSFHVRDSEEKRIIRSTIEVDDHKEGLAIVQTKVREVILKTKSPKWATIFTHASH